VTRPILSVVIPTWNRARLVCEAIESALSQRRGQVEVIVVDDGSTDGTAELLKERFRDQIKLLRQPRRGGAGAARNAGVSQATGDFLAFLDSDDLWLPEKLDTELSVFDQFPDAEAVISDSRYLSDDELGRRSRFEQNGLLEATQGRVGWMLDSPWLWTVCQNGVWICAITLRRQAVAALGQPLFSVDLNSCEDWELQIRVYQQCRVVVLPTVFSHIGCIDDGTRIGRACAGTSRSQEQEIGLLRDRLTAMARTVRPDRLTPELAAAFEHHRSLYATRLEELTAVER
jgi:glycosyltransferase involved in cell wall biosynthesis